MNILILKYAAIIIGAFILADGIGSALVKDGQYHNIWFDGERYLRAGAGALLIIIGALT
jgi:hypothetical protein